MNDWKEYILEDFVVVNPSERLPKGTIAKKIAMEFLEPFTKRITSFSEEEYKGGTKFRNGDTIMARITPSLENGKTSFVDILDDGEIGFGSTEYIVFRERNKISDKNFIYYLTTSPIVRNTAIKSMTGSSGRQRVQTDVVKKHNILVPELPEQKQIAEVLTSLDDKIELLHRQNKTLETLAETLFREWFIEKADENWEEKSLGEILTISSSKRIYYKEYVSSGVPFYRSKEIIELSKNGTTSSELFISEDRFNEIAVKYGFPKENEILLTSVGTLGISYRVRKGDKFYFKDGNLTWFSDFKDLSSEIIFCWLNSSIGKQKLDNISIGSTQSALTISGLRKIKITIPPKDIQDRLSSQLKKFYEKTNSNQFQINTLTMLRDGLLPKLMSGIIKLEN